MRQISKQVGKLMEMCNCRKGPHHLVEQEKIGWDMGGQKTGGSSDEKLFTNDYNDFFHCLITFFPVEEIYFGDCIRDERLKRYLVVVPLSSWR